MLYSELTIIEKVWIAIHCHQDEKRGRFFEYTNASQMGSGQSFDISPFVVNELGYYAMHRRRLLDRAIYWTKHFSGRSLLWIRFYRFPIVICKIDEYITETEQSIKSIKDDFDNKIRILEEQRNTFKEAHADHHAQSCTDRIHEYEAQKLKKIQRKEKKLLSAIYDKIKTIRSINARINSNKSHHLLRIRYYYGCVKRQDTVQFTSMWPIDINKPDCFKQLCEEIVTEEHTTLLNAAEAKKTAVENHYKNVLDSIHSKNETEKTNNQDLNKSEEPPEKETIDEVADHEDKTSQIP